MRSRVSRDLGAGRGACQSRKTELENRAENPSPGSGLVMFFGGGFLGFDLGGGCGDLALEVFTGFFELAHALANTPCQLGQLLRTTQ